MSAKGIPAPYPQPPENAQLADTETAQAPDPMAPLPQGAPSGQMVDVVDPDGTLGSIPSDQLHDALTQNYRLATADDHAAFAKEQKYGTPGQQAIAGVEGVGQGLLGPIAPAIERGLGVKPEDIRGRHEVNPGIHGTGEAAGLIGPAVASLGVSGEARAALEGASHFTQAGLLEKAGAGAAKAVGLGAPSTLSTKIAAGAVKGAAENALFSLGDEASKAVEQDPHAFADNMAAELGFAGLVGAGVGGGLGATGHLWQATVGNKLQSALEAAQNDANGIPHTGPNMHPVLKKTLATFGGVSEKDIDAYLANRAALTKLPESDEIYQHALNHVESINDQVAQLGEQGAEGVSNAKEVHLAAQAAYNNLEADMNQAFRERGFNAHQASVRAKDALKQAQMQAAEGLQSSAVGTADEVVGAVQKLRDNMTDLSTAAKETLNASDKTVNLGAFYNKGQELLDTLRSRGTTEAKAMAGHLQTYLDGLHQDFGGLTDIPAARVKPLLQGLDDVSHYGFTATEFDKGLSKQYKQLRYTLDDSLKATVPEYEAAMRPTAEHNKLLKQLSDYDEPEKAARRIRGLTDPVKYKEDMGMLRDLEAKTGADFTSRIEPYASPAYREELSKAVPEWAEHQRAAKLDADLKDPRTRAAMDEALANTPEHKALAEARAAKEAAILAKEEAKTQAAALKAQVKGVTQSSLEGKLASLGKGKEDAQRIFANFPELNGQSLEDVMKLKRLNEAFEKGSMHGSRNVNLWGGILGGIGGAMTGGLGHVLGLTGAGAAIGGYADKYGPQATRKVLDAYLDHFGDVAKMTGKGSPEALRMAMAKAVDSDKPANAQAFKSTAEYIHSAMKGEALIRKATKSVLKAGAEVIPLNAMPSEAGRAKLDKTIQSIQKDPQQYLNTGDKAAYYMPDQGSAVANRVATISNYLNSIRPNTQGAQPLDSKAVPNAAQKSAYNQALDIAQQPLVVMAKLAQGRLVPADIHHLQSMYPALLQKLQAGVMEQITDLKAKGELIPYPKRMGLAMFLGQPLDSSMTPAGIMGAQPKPPEATPATASAPASGPKHSTSALAKLSSSYETPTQASSRRGARA